MQWCRRFLPITITDMPGGDHRVDPPQRIPPGRECMFEPLDRIILVQRHGSPSAHLWLEELQRASIRAPIAAIVSSRDPTAPPRIELATDQLAGRTCWRAVIDGLDRKNDLLAFAQAVEPELKTLWNAVLRASGDQANHK
ncbi:MAG: hypothetical protein KatS3mg105_5150 [Gemmatales bacterium]|nr:MAG: hypothetical protein KatS3mg105_5150 [Gemmatales bacterium]GIW97839.1 MAG: hypothetical protein KatS3mg111_1172 [Pirellulaceae bacterium]